MDIQKEEGITLQSIPYKEKQKIITVFTKKSGIISLMVKGISKKNTSLISISDPFCKCNFIYQKSRSDIFFLKDLELIDKHLLLREDLENIQIACEMAKAILKSQMPNKKAISLYILFRNYLKKLPHIKSKDSFFVSFLLKTLIHEGLFTNDFNTSSIENFSFSKEEQNKISTLAYAKSFKNLEIDIKKDLKDKIYHLFYDLI